MAKNSHSPVSLAFGYATIVTLSLVIGKGEDVFVRASYIHVIFKVSDSKCCELSAPVKL